MNNGLSKSSRLDVVDAFRGFAMVGVCFVHILEQYSAGVLPPAASEVLYQTLLDKIIGGVNFAFFIGKFYMLFSFLFGLSFFLQMDNAAKKGESIQLRFLWRLTLLFGFGVIHHYFYRGDILTTYAVLGILLLPLNHLSTKTLLIISGLLLLGSGRYLSVFLFEGGMPLGLMNFDPTAEVNSKYYDVVKNGGLRDVFEAHAIPTILIAIDFMYSVFGRGYVTLALFILGICVGRCGIFHDPDKYKSLFSRLLKWFAGFTFLALVITGVLFFTAPKPLNFGTWHLAFALTAYDAFNFSLAIIYTCTFMLLAIKNKDGFMVRIFAPYGRMALSNYILQAVIGTAIFFGWGLGIIGELGLSLILPIAVVFIALQLYLSKLWMSYFRYGPLEWVWRSLTQWKLFAIKN